jgi:acyl carrier protein
MEADALGAALRAWLAEQLDLRELGRDQELVSSGLVDSGNLVLLATWLEDRTGIEIPDDDIDATHFETIAKIVALVSESQAGSD